MGANDNRVQRPATSTFKWREITEYCQCGTDYDLRSKWEDKFSILIVDWKFSAVLCFISCFSKLEDRKVEGGANLWTFPRNKNGYFNSWFRRRQGLFYSQMGDLKVSRSMYYKESRSSMLDKNICRLKISSSFMNRNKFQPVIIHEINSCCATHSKDQSLSTDMNDYCIFQSLCPNKCHSKAEEYLVKINARNLYP